MAGSKKSVVIISYAFLSGAIADGVGTELLSLGPSARESITRQLVSTQKSRQLAQDLSCVRVVTGTETDNDGYLSVSVDSTVVVQQANFALGEVVLNTCYSTCPPTFSVTNSDTNAWTGFIYWAYYGKFESGMTCTNCGSGTGPTYPGYVAVDGDGNSGAQAAVTCLDGATCTIEAPACTLPRLASCRHLNRSIIRHHSQHLSQRLNPRLCQRLSQHSCQQFSQQPASASH